jgi:hypothetical protein
VWLEGVAFGLVAVVAIAEMILAARWNRFYCTRGLPLLVRRIERTTGLVDVSLEALQQRGATAAGAPYVFRRLGPDVIAFREHFSGGTIHYIPLMHGLIRHDPEEPFVTLIGFANWFIVAFVAAILVCFGRHLGVTALYLVGALALLYLIQAVRFGRIAKGLA